MPATSPLRHAGKRLAAVDAFELRQFVGMGFDQRGETQHDARAFRGRRLAPRSGERAARGLDGAIDIGCRGFRRRGDHIAGGRVENVGASPGVRLDHAAVDQQVMFPGEKAPRGFTQGGMKMSRHVSVLLS